jgi:dethiobiotin synthetase
MNTFFITATGTDIGKTFVTTGLIRHLRAAGLPVSALKPIVSGFDAETAAASDPGVLLAALDEPMTRPALNRISPWRFAAPLSPDMAAAREGKEIDFEVLVDFCRDAIRPDDGTLFIEGVGGVMVPLDRWHTVLDWMKELGQPAILVAGSYLGTISHTLTALDCMARRNIVVRAVAINESGDSPVPLDETVAAIARFAPRVRIVTIPRVHQLTDARENFAALWDAIG